MKEEAERKFSLIAEGSIDFSLSVRFPQPLQHLLLAGN